MSLQVSRSDLFNVLINVVPEPSKKQSNCITNLQCFVSLRSKPFFEDDFHESWVFSRGFDKLVGHEGVVAPQGWPQVEGGVTVDGAIPGPP